MGCGWEGGLEESDKYNKKYILVQMRGRFSCSENQKHGLVAQMLLAGLLQSLTVIPFISQHNAKFFFFIISNHTFG